MQAQRTTTTRTTTTADVRQPDEAKAEAEGLKAALDAALDAVDEALAENDEILGAAISEVEADQTEREFMDKLLGWSANQFRLDKDSCSPCCGRYAQCPIRNAR